MLRTFVRSRDKIRIEVKDHEEAEWYREFNGGWVAEDVKAGRWFWYLNYTQSQILNDLQADVVRIHAGKDETRWEIC